VRTKELRQVRRLAQEVLLQRSDVEAFLVSSIQQVRAEMAAEVAAAGVAAGPAGGGVAAAAAGVLPPQAQASDGGAAPEGEVPRAASSSSGGGGSTVSPSKSNLASSSSSSSLGMAGEASSGGGALAAAGGGGAGQADIKQLSWQDRERILRLLFAKINRAAQVGGRGGGRAGLQAGRPCWPCPHRRPRLTLLLHLPPPPAMCSSRLCRR
jgi:hypothetical protein